MRPAVWLALLVCAFMTFAFISSELLPIGLLTSIAPSLHVSLPETGALVTVYAFVVTAAGPPLTALCGTTSRKKLFLMLATTLALSAAAAALAQTYEVLLAARVVNALAHGIFWSIILPTAASLVPPAHRGTAVAVAYGGSSLGIVAGVPALTLLGERLGWHAAFWCIALFGAVAFAALAVQPALPAGRPSALADIRALLQNASFRRLIAVTTLVITGYFTAFTYFAPLLVHAGARAAGGIASLLFVYGAAGLVSNFAFGPLAHRNPRVAVLLGAGLMALAFSALAFPRDGRIFGPAALAVVVALWGVGSSGVVVAFGTRVLAAQPDRPDVASALNSSAFNVGIGGGAFVGGLVLRHVGLDAIPVVAACLLVIALGWELAPQPAPRIAR